MPYSTTSIEPVTLGDSSNQLTFSGMELHGDTHAVIVKCNVMNTGKHDEAISSQYFIMTSGKSKATPKVSYISEQHKQGTLWTWKKLKPGEVCTVILRYQLESSGGNYEFNYLYRQNAKLVKTFYAV